MIEGNFEKVADVIHTDEGVYWVQMEELELWCTSIFFWCPHVQL